MYVSHPTEIRLPFILARLEPDLFTISPENHIINNFFFRCITAGNTWVDYWTTLRGHLRLFWRLRNGKKGMRYHVCKALSQTLTGMGHLRKSRRKSSTSDLFSELDCVTSIRWEQLRITFSSWKKSSPIKPKMSYFRFERCHLNQARTRTLSPLPGPGQCRPSPQCTLDRDIGGVHSRSGLCG